MAIDNKTAIMHVEGKKAEVLREPIYIHCGHECREAVLVWVKGESAPRWVRSAGSANRIEKEES